MRLCEQLLFVPGLVFSCCALSCVIQNKQKVPKESLKFDLFPQLQSRPQNSSGTSAW